MLIQIYGYLLLLMILVYTMTIFTGYYVLLKEKKKLPYFLKKILNIYIHMILHLLLLKKLFLVYLDIINMK